MRAGWNLSRAYDDRAEWNRRTKRVYETYDSSVLKPVQRKVTLKFDKKEIEAAAKRTEERLKKEQKKMKLIRKF